MSHRHELTDEQWKQIEPLLPPQQPDTGRPRTDHRQIINGILWILGTGAPWRDLPERYGPWQTVYGRFNQWREDGLWQRIFEQVQVDADQHDNIEWEIHFVDSTMARAASSMCR